MPDLFTDPRPDPIVATISELERITRAIYDRSPMTDDDALVTMTASRMLWTLRAERESARLELANWRAAHTQTAARNTEASRVMETKIALWGHTGYTGGTP